MNDLDDGAPLAGPLHCHLERLEGAGLVGTLREKKARVLVIGSQKLQRQPLQLLADLSGFVLPTGVRGHAAQGIMDGVSRYVLRNHFPQARLESYILSGQLAALKRLHGHLESCRQCLPNDRCQLADDITNELDAGVFLFHMALARPLPETWEGMPDPQRLAGSGQAVMMHMGTV